MTISRRLVLIPFVLLLGLSTQLVAGRQESAPPPIVGRWDMTVTGSGSPYPSWLEVQRSGKRPMSAGDFLRGFPLAPGTRLRGPG